MRKHIYRKDSIDMKIDPFILSGSRIIEGNGKVLVVGVGRNSIKGYF